MRMRMRKTWNQMLPRRGESGGVHVVDGKLLLDILVEARRLGLGGRKAR